jgi:hypothetical protein
LLEDEDVGIGIFPESEESGVGGAGFGWVTCEGIGAGETEMGQRADGFVAHDATPIHDFLKLGRGLRSLMRSEKGLASNIDGIEIGPEGAAAGNA